MVQDDEAVGLDGLRVEFDDESAAGSRADDGGTPLYSPRAERSARVAFRASRPSYPGSCAVVSPRGRGFIAPQVGVDRPLTPSVDERLEASRKWKHYHGTEPAS